MRLILIVLAAFAGPACYTTRYEVLVPRTEEGQACRRECLQVFATCQMTLRCEALEDECLLTCPGAKGVLVKDYMFDPSDDP